MSQQKKEKFLRPKRGSSLAEFGPAMWLFFLFIVFPLFNLVQFACGVATVALIARQAAQACASSPSFNDGLTAARTTATNMATSGFGKFGCLKPVNQYGISVYIDQTNLATNQQTVFGPDQPMTSAVDSTNNIYEIETRCLYDVGPMLPMQNVPFIGDIPLIGKAYRLGFSSERAAEFPDGLTTQGNATSTSSNTTSGSTPGNSSS
jgi:hypothetical protein